MGLLIFSRSDGISVGMKYGLAFVPGMLLNYGRELMILSFLNIYITFCPKDIEATFSTFYLSLKMFSLDFSTVLAHFIIDFFNI